MGTIVDREGIIEALRPLRESGKKIVFTNGCFDLLHPGHTRSLRYAKDQGDVLVVGLNSDQSVRHLKGIRRPILPLQARLELLAALSVVDFVTSFDEDTPEKLIEQIVPDVLVKGADYAPDEIAGAAFVKENGGEVKRMALVQGWSTSQIVEDVVHRYTHPTDAEPTPPFGTKIG